MIKKVATSLSVFFVLGTLFFVHLSVVHAATWTTQTGSGALHWQSVASSADGTKIIAAVSGGDIYTSIDSGVTWIDQTASGSRDWRGVASSANGNVLVGVVNNGDVYVSTNSGVSWSDKSALGTRQWFAAASSADGSRLAVAGGGDIYTSTDSGATWTDQTGAGSQAWYSIASSADGMKLAAVASFNDIYTSTDGGVTWVDQTAAGSAGWFSIASSADGTRLAAVTYDGLVYTSADSGVSWTHQVVTTSNFLFSITSSADGTKLAVAGPSDIYTSGDAGVTWTDETTAGSLGWFSIASSADGTKLVALPQNQYAETGIFTLPAISSISAAATATTSVVTWNTDVTSDSQMVYGLTTSYGSSTALSSSLVTTHSVSVTGLSCNTTYHYAVISRSASGFAATSSDQSLTTTNCPAIISSISATPTVSTATIIWTTDLSSDSQVVYGATSSYGSATSSVTFLTSHRLVATGLSCNTTYHYAVVSHTASGGVATSSDQTVTTGGCVPTISAISATPTTNTIAITWTTDLSSDSQVVYGLTPNYGSATTLNSSLVFSHSVTLNNLGICIVYHYAVVSHTASGGVATSSDQTSVINTCSGGIWAVQSASGLHTWQSITSSANGTKLAVVDRNGGDIYTSTDSGATWTDQTNAGSRTWWSITSSADGSKLSAVVSGGDIYTSADSGATWTDRVSAGARPWWSITSSADGSKLVAATSNGNLYASSDGGVTWASLPAAGSRNWRGVASSADGTKLAAVVNGGDIYTSTDSGATWTDQTNAGSQNWVSIASSADGTHVAAVGSPSDVYTSADGGVTWTHHPTLGSGIVSITSSSDGMHLAVVVQGGDIYMSGDGGFTWIDQSVAGATTWSSIASSADGTKLAVASHNLYVVTGTFIVPSISSISLAALASSTATVGWITDLTTDSQVIYGLTTGYGSTTTLSTSLVTSHSVTVTNLSCGTTYHYAVVSRSGNGFATTSTDQMFTTSACPPNISSVSATPTANMSSVSWTTDLSSDSQVLYGTTASYESASSSAPFVTSHSINLSGLSSCTLYHYAVVSHTAQGGAATSSDQTFTTSACPPTISSISATPTTSTSPITWVTDLSSDSQVVYGLTTSYGSATTLSSSLLTNHSTNISGLSSCTLYHFAVVSHTASGGVATSSDQTLKTDGCPPTVSSINATPGVVTATVTWLTDISSDSQVIYGSTSSYGSTTTLDPSLVTNHSVAVSNLSCNTTYHYAAVSHSAGGFATTSSDQTLTTTACPPIISSISSASTGSTATITWTTDLSSDTGVVYGTTSGYGSATTSASLVTNHSATFNNLTSCTLYHFAVVSHTAGGVAATSSDQTVTTTGCPPVLSSISAIPTATTSAITWTTDLSSNSQVSYGVTSAYGATTSIDSALVTSHTALLSNLTACTVYHFQLQSSGGTSSDATFTTAGCTGSAAIASSTAAVVMTNSGGSTSLTNKVKLIVPPSYTATTSAATFSAVEIPATSFFDAVSKPAGVTNIGSSVYTLKAFVTPTTTLDTFAAPLTVTMSYNPSDITNVNPSSLLIYRYDDPVWTALSGCTTDTNADTVSCQTSNFSDFVLFGTPTPVPAPTTTYSGGGGGGVFVASAPAYQLTTPASATSTAQVVSTTQSSPTTQTATPVTSLTGPLELGSTGDSVTYLQQRLVSLGLLPSSAVTGFFGPLTQTAVGTFQVQHGLVASSTSPLYGYVGPATRGLLNNH